jgi:alpha-glucosidase
MNKRPIILLTIIVLQLLFFWSCGPTASVKVISPNGKIEIDFNLSSDKSPLYSVKYKDTTIIDKSCLALEFTNRETFSKDLEIVDIKKNTHDEVYKIVAGKTSEARDHYNELLLTIKERKKSGKVIDLCFRAYDDGAAFRYIIPEQATIDSLRLSAEHSEFRFTANHRCWAIQLGKFSEAGYEKEYDPIKIDDIKPDALIGIPLTIQIENGPTVAITESNLLNHAGMYLAGLDTVQHALVSRLAPLPAQKDVCVKSTTPHYCPWRVIMIGDKPGDLIESNIIMNLADPCKLDDTSWIRPGKVIFPWWPDFTAAPEIGSKMSTANQKYYIDFASEMGLEYIELEPPWYGIDVELEKNPEHFDITRSIPELNMPELLDYAKKKNVGVLIWVTWKTLNRQMEEGLSTYEKWGAKGIKVDYMCRDDQEMVNFYTKVAETAARYHLMVFFHGAYKPTGLSRTYPNIMTFEGVMGAEGNKWGNRIVPPHNVTLPFTRMLAGPMDYTPGGFRNVTKDEFRADWKQPMVMGTRCHQLAMYVVYESPLQMVSDDPAAYRGEQGLEFLRKVPSSWDETKVLLGEIGEYIVIARRKGDTWYIGGMTNWTARELTIPLGFLGEGNFKAEIFSDGSQADKIPTQLLSTSKDVKPDEKLTIHLATGGGFAAWIEPKN